MKNKKNCCNYETKIIVFFIILTSICFSIVGMQFFELNTKEAGEFIFRSNSENYDTFTFPNNQQFNKFIWFALDGVSAEFIDPLRDLFKDHLKFFLSHNNQVRYTFEVMKTWFTGRDNDKPNYKLIRGETIFETMNRGWKSKSIDFCGELFTFATVFPHGYEKKNFRKVTDYGENRIDRDLISFSFYFRPEGKINFENYLKEVAENNISFFTYDDSTDKIQHHDYYYSYPQFKRCREVQVKFASNMKIIKDFINEHPDYLLILSTDHGRDEIDNDGRFYVHGGGLNYWNEGWIMFYNPQFTPDFRVIHTTDIAAVVCCYLKHVDIPGNSIGYVPNMFEDLNSDANVRKYNIYQLSNLVNKTTKERMIPEFSKVFSFDSSVFPKNISRRMLEAIIYEDKDNSFDRDKELEYYSIPDYSDGQWGEIPELPKGISVSDAKNYLQKWREFEETANITYNDLYMKATNAKRKSGSLFALIYCSFYFIIVLYSAMRDSLYVKNLLTEPEKIKELEKGSYINKFINWIKNSVKAVFSHPFVFLLSLFIRLIISVVFFYFLDYSNRHILFEFYAFPYILFVLLSLFGVGSLILFILVYFIHHSKNSIYCTTVKKSDMGSEHSDNNNEEIVKESEGISFLLEDNNKKSMFKEYSNKSTFSLIINFVIEYFILLFVLPYIITNIHDYLYDLKINNKLKWITTDIVHYYYSFCLRIAVIFEGVLPFITWLIALKNKNNKNNIENTLSERENQPSPPWYAGGLVWRIWFILYLFLLVKFVDPNAHPNTSENIEYKKSHPEYVVVPYFYGLNPYYLVLFVICLLEIIVIVWKKPKNRSIKSLYRHRLHLLSIDQNIPIESINNNIIMNSNNNSNSKFDSVMYYDNFYDLYDEGPLYCCRNQQIQIISEINKHKKEKADGLLSNNKPNISLINVSVDVFYYFIYALLKIDEFLLKCILQGTTLAVPTLLMMTGFLCVHPFHSFLTAFIFFLDSFVFFPLFQTFLSNCYSFQRSYTFSKGKVKFGWKEKTSVGISYILILLIVVMENMITYCFEYVTGEDMSSAVQAAVIWRGVIGYKNFEFINLLQMEVVKFGFCVYCWIETIFFMSSACLNYKSLKLNSSVNNNSDSSNLSVNRNSSSREKNEDHFEYDQKNEKENYSIGKDLIKTSINPELHIGNIQFTVYYSAFFLLISRIYKLWSKNEYEKNMTAIDCLFYVVLSFIHLFLSSITYLSRGLSNAPIYLS